MRTASPIGSRSATRFRKTCPSALALAVLMSLPVAAFASDQWEAAGSGAVAILPLPVEASMITGGSLACAEQRWSLRLRVDRQAQADALGDKASLTISQTKYPVAIVQTEADITIPISTDIVEALKSGTRLSIAVADGSGPPSATFALKGSRAVIEAVALLCSPVDMSGYTPVSLFEADPAVGTAKVLLADEAKLFRAATGKRPDYAAAMLYLPGGKRLLFASLCGSTSYYGRSGCTLSGYAAADQQADWRPVYNTQGLLLHTDPAASTDGWPDLVTLPVGGVEPERWAWDGEEYRNAAALAADATDAAMDAEGGVTR